MSRNKRQLTITLDPEVVDQAAAIAREQNRSTSGQIEFWCRRGVEGGRRTDVSEVAKAARAAGVDEITVAQIVYALQASA